MIGTTTKIHQSRRVLYPSLSICPESMYDPIFKYDEVEQHSGRGVDIMKYPSRFKKSPKVHRVLVKIEFYKRNNETR